MAKRVVSTTFRIEGVETGEHIRLAQQKLFDVYASQGIGQSAFEICPNTGAVTLTLKHDASIQPDVAVISAALARAGNFSAYL